jgi:hypothetical protein
MAKYSIENETSGKLNTPFKLLIYGSPGIGKSTFASEAPRPTFIEIGSGSSKIDVKRQPEPSNWNEVFDALDYVGNSKSRYDTIVIDPVNWFERLVDKYVCENNKVKGKSVGNIDEFDYGKGHALARAEWRRLTIRLDELLVAGFNIILVAHSQVKSFKNPIGEDYDRFRPDMNSRSADLLMQWVDDILYASYDMETYEDKKGQIKGTESGKRIIHTVESAGWIAKNRCSLPVQLPLSWLSYADATSIGQPDSADNIISKIKSLTEYVSEDTKAKIEQSINEHRDDAVYLSRVLNKVKSIPRKDTNNNE